MATPNNPGLPQANYLPPLLDEARNSFVNFTIVSTVLPKVLSTVIDMGCQKKPSQSFLDILRAKIPPAKWQNYCRRWSDDDLNHKLTQTSCDTFDVTFLYKLIDELFDNVEAIDSCLREVKGLRNDDAHKRAASTTAPATKGEVEEIISRLLTRAGELYGIGEQKIQSKIEEFNLMMEDATNSVRLDKESKLIDVREKICEGGKKDLMDTVTKQATDKLPFSRLEIPRRDVYHYPTFFIEAEQENKPSRVTSCEDLLKSLSESHLIVTGDPGSGKSTLLRILREDFVSTTKTKIFSGLADYDLLLYLECRDASVGSIRHLLNKNFPMTMGRFDDEEMQMAVDSMRDLKVLICVDGVDELSLESELLNDLIDMFGKYGQASFVFTSRSGASSILERDLCEKGLKYVTALIQPVTEEEEQIQFLNCYKVNIPGIRGDKLIESFKNLDDSCKYNCMTHPVYLSLFCHIFHTAPQAVMNWKNEFKVMEKILELSKDFVKERLILEGVKDPSTAVKKVEDLVSVGGVVGSAMTAEVVEDSQRMAARIEQPEMTVEVIDDSGYLDSLSSKLLDLLCDLTVRQLLYDKLIIHQKTYHDLCAYTFGELCVDYYTILSSVLVAQQDHMFFEYIHKTNAEFLAAKAILARLKTEPKASVLDTICRVASEYSLSEQIYKNRRRAASATVLAAGEQETTKFELGSALRFFNVFRFVLMGLCETNETDKPGSRQETILCSTIEICLALARDDSHVESLVDLSGSCPNSDEVARATAIVAAHLGKEDEDRNRWSLSTPRQMVGASLILSRCQPISLTIDPPRAWVSPEALQVLLEQVAQWHSGNLNLELEHSYTDSVPADNLVTLLDSTRCRLTQFQGCLSSKLGQQALVRSVLRALTLKEEVFLRVSLLEPRLHQLAALNKTHHRLELKARLTDTHRHTCPLPVGTTHRERGNSSSSTKPPSLTVVCLSTGADWKTVKELVEDLAPEDKRFGFLRLQGWQGSEAALNQLVLSLLKGGVWTEGTGCPLWRAVDYDKHRRCAACFETDHKQEDGRCVELLPPNHFAVTSAEEIQAITLLLHRHQPSSIKLSLPSEVELLPELLSPLLTEVAKWFKRSLHLVLEHSYWDWCPADSFLELLSTAQCQLAEFRGCISTSSAACLALGAAARRKDPHDRIALHIALKEPWLHPMAQFGAVPYNTEIHYKVQLSDEAQHCQRPLHGKMNPTPSAPSLTLVCVPSNMDWRRVDTFIKDLAPEDKGFQWLGLQSWHGTDESLELLVMSLRDAGIWTVWTGGTRWKNAVRDVRTGRCEVCDIDHNMHQDTDEDTHQDTTQDTHQDTTQDTHEDTTQDTHQDTTQDTHQDITQDTHQDKKQGTQQDTTQDTHQDTTQDAQQSTYQDTHQDTTQDTHQDAQRSQDGRCVKLLLPFPQEDLKVIAGDHPSSDEVEEFIEFLCSEHESVKSSFSSKTV